MQANAFTLGLRVCSAAVVLVLAASSGAAPWPTGETLADIRIRDPFIVAHEATQTYYLYGTGRPLGEAGFDAYKSTDLQTWEGPFPVFRPPADYWGQRDFWAPEVHRYRGRYYLFGTFSPAGEGKRGTAILVADTPAGPFTPHSTGRVTPDDWYALDGTLYTASDDRPWMVFCHEWIQIGDGSFVATRLSDDLKQREGEPVTLFHASAAPWSRESRHQDHVGRVTDGPWLMHSEDGALWMLWSTFGRFYTIGQARSASGQVTGPWVVQPEPLFTADGGHPMVFKTFAGEHVVAFHQPNGGGNERAQLRRITLTNAGFVLGEPLFSSEAR